MQFQENRMLPAPVIGICSAVSRKQNVISTWHENMQWSVMKTKCHHARAWEYAVQCQETKMSSVLVMKICSAVSTKQNVVSPWHGNMWCSVKKTECCWSLAWEYAIHNVKKSRMLPVPAEEHSIVLCREIECSKFSVTEICRAQCQENRMFSALTWEYLCYNYVTLCQSSKASIFTLKCRLLDTCCLYFCFIEK